MPYASIHTFYVLRPTDIPNKQRLLFLELNSNGLWTLNCECCDPELHAFVLWVRYLFAKWFANQFALVVHLLVSDDISIRHIINKKFSGKAWQNRKKTMIHNRFTVLSTDSPNISNYEFYISYLKIFIHWFFPVWF